MFKYRMLVVKAAFVSLALLAATHTATTAAAQSITQDETTRAVRRVLERLPYYGVFDYFAFSVERGTVTLVGYTYHEKLKADAEAAVKRVDGVDDVVNTIEVLPVSLSDDRIRWATFYRIYTDDFLSRYAPGGPSQVLHELRSARYFRGMQPVGLYPIHIVVKSGRTTLLGAVDSAVDRQVAGVRAREVTGVFNVENGLMFTRHEGRSK